MSRIFPHESSATFSTEIQGNNPKGSPAAAGHIHMFMFYADMYKATSLTKKQSGKLVI